MSVSRLSVIRPTRYFVRLGSHSNTDAAPSAARRAVRPARRSTQYVHRIRTRIRRLALVVVARPQRVAAVATPRIVVYVNIVASNVHVLRCLGCSTLETGGRAFGAYGARRRKAGWKGTSGSYHSCGVPTALKRGFRDGRSCNKDGDALQNS
jgi:hypothetical protein